MLLAVSSFYYIVLCCWSYYSSLLLHCSSLLILFISFLIHLYFIVDYCSSVDDIVRQLMTLFVFWLYCFTASIVLLVNVLFDIADSIVPQLILLFYHSIYCSLLLFLLFYLLFQWDELWRPCDPPRCHWQSSQDPFCPGLWGVWSRGGIGRKHGQIWRKYSWSLFHVNNLLLLKNV